MKISTALIDTFTSVPFKGNPTAVCLVVDELNSQTMLSIAGELNCPVTAFIKRNHDQINSYDIRYFTSITEIPACGHATLAAAKFLQVETNRDSIFLFSTINNIIIKTYLDANKIMMIYPVDKMEPCPVNDNLMTSLQLNSYKTAGYSADLETLFIEVDSADILKTLQPDYQKMIKSSDIIKEVIITSVSDNKFYDYYLRSFCPWIGIKEDPVTGSVHSVLGGFWNLRLRKQNLNAYQASSRGGEIRVMAYDEHVDIGGDAVIISTGEMIV